MYFRFYMLRISLCKIFITRYPIPRVLHVGAVACVSPQCFTRGTVENGKDQSYLYSGRRDRTVPQRLPKVLPLLSPYGIPYMVLRSAWSSGDLKLFRHWLADQRAQVESINQKCQRHSAHELLSLLCLQVTIGSIPPMSKYPEGRYCN